MQETNIGWTDFSASLVKYKDVDGNVVHACVKVSSGCARCYSEALAPRWGRKGKPFTAENMKRLTPFFDEAEAWRLLRSRKIAGKRLFLNDMTDWMGPWVSDEIIRFCFVVMILRPDVTFQTLTKHADRQHTWLRGLPTEIDRLADVFEQMAAKLSLTEEAQCQISNSLHGVLGEGHNVGWPLRNLHLGVSAEDQPNADKRIPLLLETPAAVRFVSYEPALGPVDFREALGLYYAPGAGMFMPRAMQKSGKDNPRIMPILDWLICGGESGAGHRPIPDGARWIESTVDQCRAAQVPVFVKQDSGPRPGMQGRVSDEYFVQEFPV